MNSCNWCHLAMLNYDHACWPTTLWLPTTPTTINHITKFNVMSWCTIIMFICSYICHEYYGLPNACMCTYSHTHIHRHTYTHTHIHSQSTYTHIYTLTFQTKTIWKVNYLFSYIRICSYIIMYIHSSPSGLLLLHARKHVYVHKRNIRI